MVDWHHQPIEIDDETEPDSGMGAAVRDAVARLGAARQARSGNHQHAAHALRDARVQWVCTRSDRLPRVLSKVSAGSVA